MIMNTLKNHIMIGTHTIGVLEGFESFEALKIGLSQLIEDINIFIEKGSIEIDGHCYITKFVLGGDYKVYNIKYACISYSCIIFL